MDLTPSQLDALHEGFTQLTAPPEETGKSTSKHSKRKRPTGG